MPALSRASRSLPLLAFRAPLLALALGMTMSGCSWLPWRRPPRERPPLPPPVVRTELETDLVTPPLPAPPTVPEESPPAPDTASRVADPEPESPDARLFTNPPPLVPAGMLWVHRPDRRVQEEAAAREQGCTTMLAEAERDTPERAALLAERARARAGTWRLEAALADLDEALRLLPGEPERHLQRALVLGALGRAEEAAKPLQAAFHHAPESPRTAAVLGLLRFQQGRHRDAAEALGFFVESGSADATLRLLNLAARLRAGMPIDAVSAAAVRARWPEPIGAFLSRRIDRDALRALARAVETQPAPAVACQMWFHFGQRALLQGDREQAAGDFLCALASGATSTPEYTLSLAELIRLGVLAPGSLPGEVAPPLEHGS